MSGNDRALSGGAAAPVLEPSPSREGGLYRDVLENISLGVVLLDTGTETVRFRNRAAGEILEALGVSPDYRGVRGALEFPEETVGGGPADKSPQKNIRCGEKLFGYTHYRIPGEVLCVFLLDITEKSRLMAIAESVNAMNNLGYTFSGIRHEIGNPLNSLKMTLTVLRNNIDRFDRPSVLEYLERSQAEVGRIEYLLHTLRNFNMYESLVLRIVPLSPFLSDFLSLVAPDVAAAGIRLVPFLSPEAVQVRADPRALQQVLLNLLSNAVDALKGSPEPAITLRTGLRAGRVTVRVEDNGCGMSEEQAERLFQPFNTGKPNGTGLGLVICKKMLAKMESTIEVESRRGAGTAVELSLPAGMPVA